MNINRKHNRVLAIYPNSLGFGFAILEGPLAPIDWGVVEMRGRAKNRRCLQRIAVLISECEPDVLVLQDMSAEGISRALRVRSLNQAIAVLADTQGVMVCAFAPAQVRRTFAAVGFISKQRIAQIIANQIAAFEPLLPPARKPWTSEHHRMGIFDAAALALTFFANSQ